MNAALKPTNKDALPVKELEDLERFHQQMKDEAGAWQKLLENMDRMKTERNPSTETKKPTE